MSNKLTTDNALVSYCTNQAYTEHDGSAKFLTMQITAPDGLPAGVVIQIFDEVTDEMAREVEALIMAAESREGQSDICIFINSPGGCVYSALSIISAMQSCQKPVYTVVTGLAASAAAAIACAGTEGCRYVTPTGRLMVHEASTTIVGRKSDVELENNELVTMNGEILEIIADAMVAADGPKKTKEEQLSALNAQVAKGNWYLSAQEAQKMNICNHIGRPYVHTTIGVWTSTMGCAASPLKRKKRK